MYNVFGGVKMTLKQLRIALLKQDRTMTWLAQQLGYSQTYLYKVLNDQHPKELARINQILEKGD